MSGLVNNAPQEPFLLWSSFVKPHVPYDVPLHLKDLYHPEDIPKPCKTDGELDRWKFYRDSHRQWEFDLYSEQACDQARANYYANVTFIDEQIGRILKTLENTGRIENTIIVFTSDHGDLLGDHSLWYKFVGYDGSVRVPMILWGPGYFGGDQRIQTPVSHYDIPVTLMNIAGAEYDSQDRPGVDLRHVVEGKFDRDYVVSTFYGYHVCHRDWKYNFYPNGGYEELFDLRSDSKELNNVVDHPANAPIRAKLKTATIDWLRDYVGGYGLDRDDKLEMHPYAPRKGKSPNPFSRMPWESRIPPVLVKQQKGHVGWWWQNSCEDMTAMLPAHLRPEHGKALKGVDEKNRESNLVQDTYEDSIRRQNTVPARGSYDI